MADTTDFDIAPRDAVNGPDDGRCDPDLEARLYAEIYYSNETFPDKNDLTSKSTSCDPSKALHPPSASNLPQNASTNNQFHWSIDPRPSHEATNPSMYSVNQPTVGLNPQQSSPVPLMSVPIKVGIFSKRHRALLDGVNNPPVYRDRHHFNNDQHSPRRRSNAPSKSKSPTDSRLRDREYYKLKNRERRRRNRENKFSNPKNRKYRGNSSETLTNQENQSEAPENNTRDDLEPAQKDSGAKIIEAASLIVNKSPTTVNNAKECESSSSNYNVAAKRKQQEIDLPPEKYSESSDSDDSIQEVPVPPKPPPPLINLRDSDELSSSDDEDVSPVVITKKSVDQNPVVETDTSPDVDQDSNSYPVLITTATSDKNPTEANDLIINCTEVQRGASSLEEIKRMREITAGIDDDSMTESEAMNWGRIEGQINTDKDSQSTRKTGIDKELWNQFDENTNASIIIENSSSPGNRGNVSGSAAPADEFVVCVDEVTGQDVRESPLDSRKRPRESGDGVQAGQMSEGNQKRQKQNAKATADMSFEEYVFQPMNKGLEAFYNKTRDEDCMMDVQQLQNRMPSHPRNWPILDADYQAKKSKDKRRTCAVCHREGHTRDKCPERRKPPSCHMCGEVGHLEPRCPQSMCLTCGTKFSSYRKTCEFCRTLQCSTCKGIGHSKNNCPDLWRRYHQTTREPLKQEEAEAKTEEGFKIPVLISRSTKPVNNQSESKVEANLKEPKQEPKAPTTIFNGQILFHFKSQATSMPFSLRQRVDEIPGASLAGLTAGTIFPAFITELEEICAFELLIGYDNKILHIFLQGQSKEVLKYLEQLLRMWLTRSDEEKWHMVGSSTLPVARDALIKVLKDRYALSKATWCLDDQEKMEEHLKDIRRLSELVKDTRSNFSTDRPPEVEESLKHVEKSLVDLKWKVVLCLYHCLWVTKAKETLNEFKSLMNRLKQLQEQVKEVPILIYLKILCFCNEVFIAHTSEHIIEAARKCVKCMRRRRGKDKKALHYAEEDKREFDENALEERDKMKDILNKILYQYENCKRSTQMDEKQCRKKYYTVHNLLSQLADSEALIRSLQKYKKNVDSRQPIPKYGFLGTLSHICGVLRTKLRLSKDWKRTKLDEIDRELKSMDPGSSSQSKCPANDDIIEVPVVKPKIEEFILSDSDDEKATSSKTGKNIKIEPGNAGNPVNLKIEPGTNSTSLPENEDIEDKLLLSNLQVLEDLLNDPALSDDLLPEDY